MGGSFLEALFVGQATVRGPFSVAGVPSFCSVCVRHAGVIPTPVGSTRERRSRTATRVTMAETSAHPGPTSKLPVVSLSQPTAMGPITELIAAMAAAAAVALRNVEGSG